MMLCPRRCYSLHDGDRDRSGKGRFTTRGLRPCYNRSMTAEFPSVATLMERAQARAEVEGAAEPAGLDNLDRLLASCRQTGGLSTAGIGVLEKVVVRHLVNGIRVASAPLTPSPPDVAVVVTGLPRTGTTLVHNLLALDPRWRVLRLWEALSPVPGAGEAGSPATRIAAAEAWLARARAQAPEMQSIHAVSAEGPEECDALLQNSFASQHLDDLFDARAYSRWLYQADLHTEYADHARQLSLIQAGTADRAPRPWALKSPSHLAHLDALLATYPDALVVHCHREPVEAVSSWASLVRAVRRPYVDELTPKEVGRECLRRSAVATERALAVRRDVGDDHFVDVAYHSLVVDPIRSIREIYARMQRPLAPPVEARMSAWVVENPQHKHGRHRYDPAQFALDEARVHAELRPYRQHFARALA